MNLTNFLLLLVLMSQMLILVVLIRWSYQMEKMCDFSKEDKDVKDATDEVNDARNNLPRRTKQPTKGKLCQ